MSPEIQAWINQLTWLDWLALAVIGFGLLSGLQRGLIFSVLDLAAALVALQAAVVFCQPAAAWLSQYVPLPQIIVVPIGFVVVLVVTQMVLGLVIRLAAGLIRGLMPGLGPLDLLGGGIFGAAKGALWVAYALLPFTVIPVIPALSSAVEQSTVAGFVVNQAQAHGLADTQPFGMDGAPFSSLTTALPGIATPTPGTGSTQGSAVNGVQKVDFGTLGAVATDADDETALLDLMNQARAQAGLAPLKMDAALQQAARAHSQEMFALSYFSHDSPVSGTPMDRLLAAGVSFTAAGENLAYAPTVDAAFQGLMNSPEHRANILQPAFGRVGIGAVKSQLRGIMFSEEFAN